MDALNRDSACDDETPAGTLFGHARRLGRALTFLRTKHTANRPFPQAEAAADLKPYLELPALRSGRAAHRILFVGALTPQTGAADLLQAAQVLAHVNPDCPVDVAWAGAGPLKPVLEAQPMPPNLRFSLLPPPREDGLRPLLMASGILFTLPDARNLALKASAAGVLPVRPGRGRDARREVLAFNPAHPSDLERTLARLLSMSEDALNGLRSEARRQATGEPGISIRQKRAPYVADAASHKFA